MNRRMFVRLSAALAAGWNAPALLAQRASAGPQPARELPPSIAALTSMRDQAKPITNDERRGRIEQARRLMSEEKIGALILTGGASLSYFTNIRWSGGERLFACVIPAKGEPFFVCPAFEEDRAREQIGRGPFAGHADVRPWQEDESPYALVASGLHDRGLSTARVGIEETAKFVWTSGIANAAPNAHFVVGTPVTAGCRMIKSAHELELMQLANTATWRVYKAVYEALQPGMTQNDASDLIDLAYGRVGFNGGASVQTGPYTALPHGSIEPQVIRDGTIIMVDDGCTVEGYQSDITRTFVLGKATEKMNRVFDIVKHAQSAALAAARPGVLLASVDAAAREVIVKAGYGPGFKYFSHRVGHGIGMEGHEWPYLVKNNMFGWTRALHARPGMTFSDEPGVYIRGEFGVRLEDDMVITQDGARLFTPQSESLEKPF
ncbi:MAG TPA: Xaa-Pro peptidase family protein [Thermoanaerobaculia bacterium]|jgi:Xaa-Pro dipeptidase|nr:Xaa-Pro peptidase family protein [Thermoanaerobaculia bacterium]